MEDHQRLADTIDTILQEQLPNLFRLYLNPYVAQICFCLERYIQETWHAQSENPEPYQSFLANSFDEALSGAIKLARYCGSVAGKSTMGLVIDPADRLGPFATAGGVVFLPGLTVIGKNDLAESSEQSCGFVVVMGQGDLEPHADRVRRLVREGALVITCVDRQRLASVGDNSAICNLQSAIPPDLVVFDESFVHHDVPFGAFAARKALYDHWNRPAKSTFHSTTFQPNTISTLHFLRCLEKDDPEFYATIADEIRLIDIDPELRLKLFRRLYSPSLARAIKATGFDTSNIRAAGSFVYVDGRKVFDAVSGVACSVRGHNPPTYAEEMAALANVDSEVEVTARLRELTGLECVLPAVSGASAVENALKVALVVQFPRRHVLALKSGFGGKTLFALTGTWNSSYKEHIGPLYGDVLYVDPFATDAIAQINAALQAHPVAVVQMELIQGVGGVRRVPEAVVRHLDACRSNHGYLLLIDEVQTGMYRTGPFTLSRAMGLTPDLLVVGKAVSDMMFPFALTLYSEQIQHRLDESGSNLPDLIRRRYRYSFGYKTAVNVLRLAERTQLAQQVVASGALFAKLLGEELASCNAVREVRVYGLLIGIELDATRWPQRWFKKKLFWFYLASMLQHPRFPVLIGFCQYEPNVLKITPPLTVNSDEIRQTCATIGEVLRRPFYQLLTCAVGGMMKSFGLWRKTHDSVDNSADERVAR
jgi:acetylornithine/succinyldiaminopimelate/putrescine aminotransferase